MCGIHAVISSAAQVATCDVLSTELRRRLCGRGPDHFGQITSRVDLGDGAATTELCFTSTVLSLRGDHVARQPFSDPSSGSILCWNGEAWKIRGVDVQGNDGEALFQLLTGDRELPGGDDAVLDALRSVEGPFAFIYFDKPAARLYFGRDRLGRRSLLIQDDAKGRVVLSSIAESTDPRWKEVEADGIYAMDLGRSEGNTGVIEGPPRIARYDWVNGDEEDLVSGIGRFNMSLPVEKFSLTAESLSVRQLRDQLTRSLRLRILNVPRPPSSCSTSDTRVAILFSGGLDCTVLARMSHDLLPSDQGVDLINVAFENPRIASQLRKEKHSDLTATDIYEACPDRVTGRKSFTELQKTCPGRAWRFLAVNVPYTETVSHRAEVVSLMYPQNTEMDLSIAYALYFSARGQGVSYADAESEPIPCSTPARVLISGLGADELFGGYVRHISAFEREGYAGLAEELKLDVARLGKRNLGRDDRIMAHWGREVRFPYLDEELVKWAIACPSWEKCDFENLGDGESFIEPGKRVLRFLAAELGMPGVAREKKRAIQFGSRTAKMESSRVKGTTLIS